MDDSITLGDKIADNDGVRETMYNADANVLHVYHDRDIDYRKFNFTDEEVEAIRDGKLTPLWADEATMAYDVHITDEEQQQARAVKFTFSTEP